MFTNIGSDCYVPTKKIVAIIDADCKSGLAIIAKGKQEDNLHINTSAKLKTKTVVWIEEGGVYKVALKSDTVFERCLNDGHKLIMVDTGIYLSAIHIKAILLHSSSEATKLRKRNSIAGNDINFVRQTLKKNSSIILKTGEVINISKLPEDFVNDIKAEC